MKIFYAVQATGNGHISRAMELLPYLEKYGRVDIFLSGSNSTLQLQAPVAFRSQGLSLHYTCDGKLDYRKTLRAISWKRISCEAWSLPVEKYDLVLNDFEPITSLACRRKKIASVHFGHQASFITHKTPRPERKNPIGEWILKNYAHSRCNVGLHFRPYDSFIEPPVIRAEIWNAQVTRKEHITVYLPAFCDKELIALFSRLPECQFEIFSRQAITSSSQGNLALFPVDKRLFTSSLTSCRGLITSAGFETPSEALFLGKKIMVIPIGGQYEQLCNAAALRQIGVPVLDRVDEGFLAVFREWLAVPQTVSPLPFKATSQIVERLLQAAHVPPEESGERQPAGLEGLSKLCRPQTR